MQRLERILATLLFCSCEATSVAFTVAFSVSLAVGVEAVAVGIVLELAKIFFSVVVITHYRERRLVTVAVASLLVAVLATVSAVASVAFFDATADQRDKDVAAANTRLERLLRQADGLERESLTLDQLAAADVMHNYRTRAYGAQQRLAELARSVEEINGRIDSVLEEAPARAVVAPSAATRLIERYRLGIVLTFAILLEVIGFAALQLSCGPGPRPARRGHGESRPVATGPKLHLVPSPDRIDQLGDDVLRRIRTGEIRPVLKDIREALGVRQVVAQEVMHRLAQNGALVREGRRYRIGE